MILCHNLGEMIESFRLLEQPETKVEFQHRTEPGYVHAVEAKVLMYHSHMPYAHVSFII